METNTFDSLPGEDLDNLGNNYNSKPKRIGGVLVFVAISTVIGILRNISNCLLSISFIVREAKWKRLTDPASNAYHPYWKPLLIYDAISCSLILLISLVVIVLFFQRRKIFPKLIVMVIPTIFILSFIDHYLSSLIPVAVSTKAYSKEGDALVVSFIAMHIWIPYFLVSKRVKETFVR